MAQFSKDPGPNRAHGESSTQINPEGFLADTQYHLIELYNGFLKLSVFFGVPIKRTTVFGDLNGGARRGFPPGPGSA